jgi:predicted metal-dependent peptidase
MAANLSDPVVQAIVGARVSLLFNQPFFGNLATRLELVDASKWCKTAATDGKKLYYNREFIKALTPEELLFLIGHEVLHCVYDHLGRKGSREHKLWNMANDYIVNYTLEKEKLGKMPKGGLLDSKYTDEMTSEEVYRLLEESQASFQMTLDEHLEMDGSDGDGDSDGDGNGNQITVTVQGGPDGPPKLTEEDKQRIRNEIKAAVINAAQAVGAGKVPAGVKRLIEDFTNPIMDWRTLLEMHIQSSIKDDFTFNRPSKRSWSIDGGASVILPGQNFKDTVDVAVCIDTSGSMTDEMLRDFLSETKGIMETFDDFKLTLWTFDTQVYNPAVFTPNNLDEIMHYDPKGGGGTMFECNWEFMRDPAGEGFGDVEGLGDAIEPKKLVMFTDGYPCGGWCPPGDEEYCDTLFIVHGNTSIVAPFGMTAYYVKDEAKRAA